MWQWLNTFDDLIIEGIGNYIEIHVFYNLLFTLKVFCYLTLYGRFYPKEASHWFSRKTRINYDNVNRPNHLAG